MSQLLTGEEVVAWVAGHLSREASSGQGIGLLHDSNLVAGAWFETIFGQTMVAHIAIPAPVFLSREFLWYIFFYPFQECDCEQILAPVAQSNLAAQRLVLRLGFSPRETLEEGPDATILFLMERSSCRWLKLKESRNGKSR